MPLSVNDEMRLAGILESVSWDVKRNEQSYQGEYYNPVPLSTVIWLSDKLKELQEELTKKENKSVEVANPICVETPDGLKVVAFLKSEVYECIFCKGQNVTVEGAKKHGEKHLLGKG